MKKFFYSISLIRLTLIEKKIKKLGVKKKKIIDSLVNYSYSIIYSGDDIIYSE